MTMDEFIAKYGIRMRSEQVYSNPHCPEWQDATHWRCLLRERSKRRMTVHFSQGFAHKGEPKRGDVLDSLRGDTAHGRMSFDAFCNEYGYNSDSIKARETWKSCKRLGLRFFAFIGPQAYDELLEIEY